MKVCHVTSAHDSNDVRIFHKECVSLAKAGYDTFLVAAGDSREEKGVHVVGLGPAPVSRRERMTKFASTVYERALEIDAEIYHLHDPELIPYGIKLKKHGKKVIFDSHENTLEQMEDKNWIPKPCRKLVSFAYKHYASSAFAKFDALISVTPHIVRQLEKINSRVCMVTNYPMLNVAERTDSKTPDELTLCFTGGIDRQWSHEVIINALHNFENVGYVLCGRAEDAYLQELRDLEGWCKVKYMGVVSHEEAKNVQKNSNIGMALLKPSKNTHGKEGTIGNTKLFEYMMAGLPIICTNFTLWKEIIEKYDCGICVDVEDENALKESISFLKNNPERVHQMGIKGREAVEREFNWSTQENSLFELYMGL